MRRAASVLGAIGVLGMLFFMGFSGARVESAPAQVRLMPSGLRPAAPILSAPPTSLWNPEPVDPALAEVATEAPGAAGCRPVSPHSPPCTSVPGRSTGILVGIERWRPLVEKYFEPEDVDRAMDVMACESAGNPRAANPTSSARGLFQHLGSFWPERARKAGRPGADIFDPDDNVAVAAWLVYHGGGWRHWNASSACW